MYTKDLKKTKGIALIYLIMIILSILIISAVAIVGVTKKVRKGGTNQEISQGTSQTAETQQKDITSNNKDTKVTAKQIAKNPEKYYGQEVKNYTKGDRVYRIFYVDTEGYFGDKNTIYLKAVSNDDYSTGRETVDYKGYNKMYCVGDEANGGIWAWMASPSSSDKFSLCMVSMKVSRFVFSIFYFSLFLDIPNSFTKI